MLYIIFRGMQKGISIEREFAKDLYGSMLLFFASVFE